MSLNLAFPISTKNSGSKINTNNFSLNEKIKQHYQAINLIPIYKNISAKTLKKKTLFEKTPENKNFNDFTNIKNKNSNSNKPMNFKNSESANEEETLNNNNNDNSYEAEKTNIFNNFNNKNNSATSNNNSNEKNLRIPLQSIKNNNLARNNKVFSAKINEKKTKNKFSLMNIEALKVDNLINNQKQLEKQNKKKNSEINNINNNHLKANLDKVRISKKSFCCVEGYAAITTEGLVRGYNEDRVSIILNIPQPQNFEGDKWPKCSFFGIYDGHGGSACADFLRDNLHKFVGFIFLFNIFKKKFFL